MTMNSVAGDETKNVAGDETVIGRRKFLAYVAAGSGLAVTFAAADPTAAPAGAEDQLSEFIDFTDVMMLVSTPFAYDFLIEVKADNRIRFEVPRAEVGQGITTAAAMILAEELDVSLESIDVGLSPAEPRRFTGQLTGSSSSVITLWDPLRKVAAVVRQNLHVAGAAALGLPPEWVGTRDGHVLTLDGRSVSYASLADSLPSQQNWDWSPEPKQSSTYRVVGKPQPRLDARDIVTGKLPFACDLEVVPGAVPTLIARPVDFGADLASANLDAARSMPGVVDVFEIPIGVEGDRTGVAVLADTFGRAERAMGALAASWSPGVAAGLSDDQIISELRELQRPTLPPKPWWGKVAEGEFIFPYAAHAPMETMTAVAEVTGAGARVWSSCQSPNAGQAKVARELGIETDQVEFNVLPSGGSFGRRLFFDAAVEAARVAKRSGRPIKLKYTRQQDTQLGRARPLSIHHVQANYFPRWWFFPSKIYSFQHRASTAALDFRHGIGDALTAAVGELAPPLFSQVFFNTTQAIQYKADQASVLLTEKEFAVPTASWRAVYSGTANVANEVIVDEVARDLGEDELQFRLAKLEDERLADVLRVAGEAGQWGRPMEPRRAQGLGVLGEYYSRTAVLAEVEYSPDPNVPLKVTKLVIVLDVNQVVNPLGLEAQALSAANDAISTIVKTGLNVENGRVRETSYGDFAVARMADTPADIQVIILPNNGERPGGAGELVVPAAGAAIANAFARATGIKPRRFPLHEHYPEA